uniref:Transposable element Hobo transposase n=1 Tax=Bactrocera dorsalis TaxID=27457 RepID=A0A034WAQ0_BACDO
MESTEDLVGKIATGIYKLSKKRKGRSAIWDMFEEIVKDENDIQAISALKLKILEGIEGTWIPNLIVWHKVAYYFYPPALRLQASQLKEIEMFCTAEIADVNELWHSSILHEFISRKIFFN